MLLVAQKLREDFNNFPKEQAFNRYYIGFTGVLQFEKSCLFR